MDLLYRRGCLLLFISCFLFWCPVLAESKPAGTGRVDFQNWSGVLKELEVREGWEKSDLKISEIILTEKGNKVDRMVTSSKTCGTGGCEYRIFERQGDRYRLVASVFGIIRRGTTAHKGRYDILVLNKAGSDPERPDADYAEIQRRAV